jgi:oxygen-independent coproporphyrinogen-3 oxidase
MSYGVYIHLPFCGRKCPYCGFVSVADADALMAPYIDAVVAEISSPRPAVFSGEPDTVYIGGGTPSRLPLPLLERPR